MIHEVTGDILLSKAKAIAHGVAPNDHFDQGLALALRERWPAMVKDFRHYCHERSPKVGGLWTWSGPGQIIVNLLTQGEAPRSSAHPGKADVVTVRACLAALRELALKEKLTSLALPKLATGVGGLDWKDVRPLVQEALGSLSLPIFVYTTYKSGVAAQEPGV